MATRSRPEITRRLPKNRKGVNFGQKNSKNGGKRPFPSIEMTVLNTKDMILCIKDDVLNIADDVLCIKDDVLCIKDDVINTTDDVLCIKDHVLNTSDYFLCIKDHVLNTTDDALCIKKAVLNTTESFLGIGKSFRKIGKQGRKPMKIAIKSLFFPDGRLDDQICKSIKFYRIIPIDNRAKWKVAKRSPRIGLDSRTNLMVINTNVAAQTTASQLKVSSQLLSQSLARLLASPARTNPGLRDGRAVGRVRRGAQGTICRINPTNSFEIVSIHRRFGVADRSQSLRKGPGRLPR